MPNRFDVDGNTDIKAVVAQYRDKMKRRLKWVGPVLILVVLALLVLSGLYSVEPGEVGVVRTFGKETGKTPPGLHFVVPFAQQVDIVNTEKIRRAEVGFRGDKQVQNEAQMITGDQNVVEAQMIVQYRIIDPSNYLFRLADPAKVLHDAAEVALRDVVGQTTVDDIMTEGRGAAQVQAKELLQKLMDQYESGLQITEIKLREVDPPESVKDAFHDVVRALEEKEQKINKAQAYEADLLPRARGEAQKVKRKAESYKIERVERSKGDAKRFDEVLAAYNQAKSITRKRLHLETMQRILSRVKNKVLIDGSVANQTLPVLPLGGVIGGAPAAIQPGGGR